MDETIKALVSQGGFAVLAALSIIVILHQGKERVRDIKSSVDRERVLAEKVLDILTKSSESMASLAAAIGLLTAEVQGFRQIMHKVGNDMSSFSAKTAEYDRALGLMEIPPTKLKR